MSDDLETLESNSLLGLIVLINSDKLNKWIEDFFYKLLDAAVYH